MSPKLLFDEPSSGGFFVLFFFLLNLNPEQMKSDFIRRQSYAISFTFLIHPNFRFRIFSSTSLPSRYRRFLSVALKNKESVPFRLTLSQWYFFFPRRQPNLKETLIVIKKAKPSSFRAFIQLFPTMKQRLVYGFSSQHDTKAFELPFANVRFPISSTRRWAHRFPPGNGPMQARFETFASQKFDNKRKKPLKPRELTRN